MTVLGLIPARGGSKGVTNKNIRELAGKSLLERAADAARESGVIDQLVLSTDNEDIASLGKALGIDVPFIRPARLGWDETPMLDVVKHALSAIDAHDIVVLLQPTSPLRTGQHIKDALSLLTADADSVVSVVEIPKHHSPDYVLRADAGWLKPFLPHGDSIERRQDARPAYARDGTVYAFWTRTVYRFGTIYGARCYPLFMNPSESLSIDTPADWERAESLLQSKQHG